MVVKQMIKITKRTSLPELIGASIQEKERNNNKITNNNKK